MRDKKLYILTAVAIILIFIFLFTDIRGNYDYILAKRWVKLLSIVLTSVAISVSTIVFQTLTNNRILTPSILGLDSLYMLLQTSMLFIFGMTSMMNIPKEVNTFVSLCIMLLFSSVLFKALFKKNKENIYFLLLVGLIIGTFFNSISSFMQMLLDPNEFQIVQDRMFASFNNANKNIVYSFVPIIVGLLLYVKRYVAQLDVMALGKEQAINLGIDYDRMTKRLLTVVIALIAMSTALVGPITFLGLLVANMTYELFRTIRHDLLFIASTIISVVVLVGGQLLVERIFSFSTTVSVIVNFIGGIYLIYLLTRRTAT